MTCKTTKVLVLGATGVGKTSLIRSILNEPLSPQYEPTQDDWYSGFINAIDGTPHRVQFLDTGGYDDFPELINCYMKVAVAFIVVVEQNCVKSTNCAERIVKDVRACRGKVPILCVSTKCDAELISAKCILQRCGANEYITCSSHLNIGMSEVKQFLGRQVLPKSSNSSPKTIKKPNASHNLRAIFHLKTPKNKDKKQTTPLTPLDAKVQTTKPPLVRKSSSHPDLSRAGIKSLSVWFSPATGSASKLNKLPISQTTGAQLNDIYKKYGYEKKQNPNLAPVHPSSSMGNLATSIRSSTTSIVKSVQETLTKLSVQ